jgi:succinylarginine dihydrolase
MSEPVAHEVNFDGLVGPTHSYAGLSYGNLASQRHGRQASNPRRAALEGLAKMKRLADLGVRQAVLPPHERPDVPALRRLGFAGTDAQVLARAAVEAPVLLASCCSASPMWAANAATVSPSADTADGRLHFTPANLVSQFHRSLEPPTTAAVLRAVFPDDARFAHHRPLPAALAFADEGAANHTRLCAAHGSPGVELFVYGRAALDPTSVAPARFPARQTLEASAAVARRHGLDPSATVFLQQAPRAIEAGAFHNDVVAVGNLDVLLVHGRAFARGPADLAELQASFARVTGRPLTVIEVGEGEVSLADAVGSYLFNSQLVRLPDGSTVLVAPAECDEIPSTRAFLAALPQRSGGRIAAVHLVDVRQSMRNGGGPACLRLRVVLTDDELRAVHPRVLLTDALYAELVRWVDAHYREELHPADLADPQLLEEGRGALDALTRLLDLGPIYPFQR